MKASIRYVEQKFDEFNRQMFGGKLPKLPVRMSDAVTFLGMCVAKVRNLPDGRRQHHDFELRVSLRHDIPERDLEDVIIHEMIHYFIMYNELNDTAPHGELFKAMMRSINRTYGRNITISRRSTPEERTRTVEGKRKWHVIASIRFRNGKHGVKVLPRVVPKIIDYYRQVMRADEIAAVELFLHDNPFFNRYPTSAALRVHEIDASLLRENLAGAHTLSVEDGKLIQR
ncbi:MAG: SprT-like domain-containing protein [Muribaculaceae bacterium]|nr:SprT-like domain-containing protein [Muribaculaceae bacterium]